jgi:predicted S18 family serine protease
MREAIEKAELETVTDLEASMIASARLSDAERALRELDGDDPDPGTLAYASERLETARAWYGVIGRIGSKPFDLSQDALDGSCRRKLDEARERVNYASYLYPDSAEQLEESIRSAFSAAQRQHSALCILQASMAKAEANALLTALAVPEEDFEDVTARKAAIAQARIGAQTARDAFPILAYSYGEYADAFTEDEAATRALYTEYALELSSIPSSLSEKRSVFRVDLRTSAIFALGAVAGVVVGILIGSALARSSSRRSSRTGSENGSSRTDPSKRR